MPTPRVLTLGGVLLVAAALGHPQLPPTAPPPSLSQPAPAMAPVVTPLDPLSARFVDLANQLGENPLNDPEVTAWRCRPIGPAPQRLRPALALWRSSRAEIVRLVDQLNSTSFVDLDDGHIPTAAEIRALINGAMPGEVLNALRRCGQVCADSLRDDPNGTTDLIASDALIASTQRQGNLIRALVDFSLRAMIGQAQVDRAGVRGFEPGITDHAPGVEPPLQVTVRAFRSEADTYARPLLRFVLAAPASDVRQLRQELFHESIPEVTLVSRMSMALMAVSSMNQCRQMADLLEGQPAKEPPPFTLFSNVSCALVASQALKSAISIQEQQIAADLLRRRQDGEDLVAGSAIVPGPAGTSLRWQAFHDHIRVDLAPDSPLPSYIAKPNNLRLKAAEAPKPNRSGLIQGGLAREIPVTPINFPRGVQ